ncbi:MAG: Cache 3/Cache 2 fusion domain-containing protein [Desulfuromonadales bacterium]|nr:Cache 3/Cache 2 fusion domain-containing protein [Desulfuromonadales bacterium]
MVTPARFLESFKRSLVHAVLIVLVMLIFTTALTAYLKKRLDSRTEAEMAQQVSLLVNTMSSYHAALADSADKMSAVFCTYFPGKFRLDSSKNVTVGNRQTPLLLNGSTPLNLNNGITDRFTEVTKVAASIFVRSGDDFVRIATSVNKEDGSRAIGTMLEREHPAYSGLLKGEAFVGKATLFNKDYMTKYVPVKDNQGNVIAVLFVGLDFTDSLKVLKDKLRAITIGKSGYFYALEAHQGNNRGRMQIHPFIEGTNISDVKDVSGREFIREILTHKEGVIRYTWLNKESGEAIPREKLVVYRYLKEWDWIIAAGAPLSELNSESRTIMGAMAGATALVSIILVLLSVSMVHMERKLTSELQASEKRYRELFHSMQNGFALHEIICDEQDNPSDYRFLEVNPAFETMTGLKAGDIVGKTVREVLPDIEDSWIKTYGQVALIGESRHIEKYSAEFQRYYEVNAYSSQTGRFATIIQDVTQRKLAEEALRQKNAEMERFTYTVSHDMKTPLVTIKTFIGFLEQDLAAGDPDRVKQDFDFIQGAATKMEGLLNELLELSRVGHVLNSKVTVCFQDLIDDALAAAAGIIASRGVRISRSAESILLSGDRPRLGEVWQNLIENAVKYMGDQPDPQIEIGVEARGVERVFFVRDNGMGVDPRYTEKIFGLFEKLDPTSEGSGLGLALVKRIVEVHGGRTWVDSEGIGRGSTFCFTFGVETRQSLTDV